MALLNASSNINSDLNPTTKYNTQVLFGGGGGGCWGELSRVLSHKIALLLGIRVAQLQVLNRLL